MIAISRLFGRTQGKPAPQVIDLPSAREAFSPGADDSFVNAAVKSALSVDRALAHSGIHVSTSFGEVQLSGFVPSREVMARAVEIARGVSGVRAIRNDMRRRRTIS